MIVLPFGAAAEGLSVKMLTVSGPGGDLMVQQGDFALSGSSLVPAGQCPVGPAGQRLQNTTINFSPPFSSTPTVTVGINEFDSGDGRNIRIKAFIQNVSATNATLVIETWCDTNLYSVTGSFVAAGLKEQGRKICSVYVPGGWRSMTSVPDSWTKADCQAVLPTVGANTYALGCEFSNGVKWSQGAPNGGLPGRNCGW
jgi:H-type lectin domain-containing protein